MSREPISFIASVKHAEASEFYTKVLGFDLLEDSPFAMAMRRGDEQLRIQKVESLTPQPFTAHGWKVADIEGEITKLVSHNIETIRYKWFQQSGSGVWTTPDGAKVCWFADPDGNILSFTQFVD